MIEAKEWGAIPASSQDYQSKVGSAPTAAIDKITDHIGWVDSKGRGEVQATGVVNRIEIESPQIGSQLMVSAAMITTKMQLVARKNSKMAKVFNNQEQEQATRDRADKLDKAADYQRGADITSAVAGIGGGMFSIGTFGVGSYLGFSNGQSYANIQRILQMGQGVTKGIQGFGDGVSSGWRYASSCEQAGGKNLEGYEKSAEFLKRNAKDMYKVYDDGLRAVIRHFRDGIQDENRVKKGIIGV